MTSNMQKYLDKAQVLIEGLPYIQRSNRKIIVLKYGGSAMAVVRKSASGLEKSEKKQSLSTDFE